MLLCRNIGSGLMSKDSVLTFRSHAVLALSARRVLEPLTTDDSTTWVITLADPSAVGGAVDKVAA